MMAKNPHPMYKYGKEGEKIVAELFRAMGFKVTFIGVEHRRHYVEKVSAKDIFSPDLKLYDDYNEKTYYMEIKSLIRHENDSFTIEKDLLLNYAKYYPKNSFLVLYLPSRNRIGMTLFEWLVEKRKLEKYARKNRYYKRRSRRFVEFPFEQFKPIRYFGLKHIMSFKFNWDEQRIRDFLAERQHIIKPYLEEATKNLPPKRLKKQKRLNKIGSCEVVRLKD